MRWAGRRQSTNVEDRRGVGGRGIAVGGGIGAIIITVIILLLGGNPGEVLDQVQNLPLPGATVSSTLTPDEQRMGEFVAVVLADTEDIWNALFTQMGRRYREPRLVLYSGSVQTGSGYASAATGPFYSPQDETIYIDLSFFDQLGTQYGAPGDFAQAYVIAHEVGHHVQKQLGILDQVSALQRRVSEEEANALSVKLELQADFLAGVWAHYADTQLGVLEAGDAEEAMAAAGAVGDDRIQMRARGYVVPDSFTHGTSEQRARWFTLGLRTGDLSLGDTFSATSL
ncbi:MAG: zinc metallopeptidase [Actinobacteria bacterium]|nr:zinc metallopeptidase [Actinomycetota bacterium]